MEVLVLDGKNYVKASKAARDLGYATDYVGQLCRTGQVDAHLIGRTWYVNPDQLGTHRVEKKRMSRTKAREQARRLIVAERSSAASSAKRNTYKNVAISYEQDAAPLMPETRRLSIAAEKPRYATHVESSDEQETVIENRGEKIRLSGNLNVVDVTDTPEDAETTVLSPRIFHARAESQPIQKEAEPATRRLSIDSESAEDEVEPKLDTETDTTPISFEARLAAASTDSADISPTEPEPPVSIGGNAAADVHSQKYSYFIHAIVHVAILITVMASFAVYTTLTYDTEQPDRFSAAWNFSVEEAVRAFSIRF
jgi:hypothetical protein